VRTAILAHCSLPPKEISFMAEVFNNNHHTTGVKRKYGNGSLQSPQKFCELYYGI
jgi:hypothetical protein